MHQVLTGFVLSAYQLISEARLDREVRLQVAEDKSLIGGIVIRAGDLVGIFSIVYLSNAEVILCDIDKHLKVEVSVCKAADKVSVSTVVHTHNTLGRIYMLFVAPLHRRIVPASLRQASLG